MSCWKRFRRTFCAQPPKSAFRSKLKFYEVDDPVCLIIKSNMCLGIPLHIVDMRLNRVANSGRMYNFGFFDNLNNWLDTPPRIGGSTDSREIIQVPNTLTINIIKYYCKPFLMNNADESSSTSGYTYGYYKYAPT